MGGERVLVVDDYDDSRELYAEYLQFVGFDVSTAADGAAAVECAQSQACDVIVLDIALPKLDGLTVLRQLRSSSATRDVPVIVLSASVSAELRAAAMAAGAHRFLTKPCPPEEVEKAIREVLAPRSVQ
jgi:CheY-like chemotaxis protein